MLHRYNKRKPSLPRRSPSCSKDSSLGTVKMSFIDDYIRDPTGYSRALNNHRATQYYRRSSDPNTTQSPTALPSVTPALPTFEINVMRGVSPDAAQLESQRKNLEAVFNRIFVQHPAKPALPSRPRPNPAPMSIKVPVTPAVDDMTGLEEFSDITRMKPSVSTCNVRWAKAPPMDISQYPLAQTLSPAEQECCSNLRLLPKQYIEVKHTLIRAGRTYPRGTFKKRDAQKLCRIDVNKTSKVFEWFVKLNWIPNTLCRNLNKIC